MVHVTFSVSRKERKKVCHVLDASSRQRGVGYLRIFSGSLGVVYTSSQGRECALPEIHNTPGNIRALAFTSQKYYAKWPCLRCQLFSAPPHLV